MNKILKYFKSTPVQSIIYAAILKTTLALTITLFGWSLIFVGRLVDSLIASPKEEALEVSGLDINNLTPVAKKLNISLPVEPEATRAPATLPPSVAPQVQEPPKVPAPESNLLVGTTSTVISTTTKEVLSPEPSISKDKISLQILNGTFTAGLAKSWQIKFEAVGFQNILIGNAKERNYRNVEVTYKPSKKEVLSLIKEVLEKEGAILGVEKEGQEEDQYDFVIIVGQ